jgi:hypothetical protein
LREADAGGYPRWMVISLLMAVLAHAEISQYQIAAKVIVDGRVESSPILMINEGMEGSCGSSSEGYEESFGFRPVAREGSVLLDVGFSYRKGKREMNLHTQVNAKLGESLELPLNTRDSIQLTVTRPQR